MSFPKSDSSTQQKLSYLTDRIESSILSSGYEITRSEIIGYLLEFLIVESKLDEIKLNEFVGSVEDLTTEIVAMKDIQWPLAPWYGKEINYPLESTDYKSINQARSSQFMNFYQYLQMVLMLPSIYVLILVLLSFSLALIRGDPNSFTISVGISTNSLFVFYYFGIHSLINFPITAKISNNNQLRAGADDMEAWLYKMKRLSFFQTFSFISFSLMMFIGSFAEVQISDSQMVYESHPANGIELTTTLTYILFTSFAYYQGILKLHNTASGRILREHLSKQSRRVLTLGLSFITFSKSLITLSLAFISIKFLELLNSFDEGIVVQTQGVESFLTILALIYLSLDMIIFIFLNYANPSSYTRLLRKNTIRNNLIQIINWIIFVIPYSYLSIKLLAQENNRSVEPRSTNSVQTYLFGVDFARIIILTSLHLIVMWIIIIFTGTHKGNEFDEETNNF